MTFSTNSDIDMDEVDAARRGRLAFFKGEEEGEAWASTSRLNYRELVFFGSVTAHLILSPSARGEATKTPACGHLWRPLPQEVA